MPRARAQLRAQTAVRHPLSLLSASVRAVYAVEVGYIPDACNCSCCEWSEINRTSCNGYGVSDCGGLSREVIYRMNVDAAAGLMTAQRVVVLVLSLYEYSVHIVSLYSSLPL